MHNEYRLGGWEAEHGMPFGTEWIKQSWLPMADYRTRIDRGVKHVTLCP